MRIEPTEEAVASADGTRLGFRKLGSGPGLVVAHGSLTTGDEWLPVARALADRFTCCLLDRRGRGRSADAAPAAYTLEKEAEDLRAVLEAAGPGAALLGHSYGAVCALEAARRFPPAKLALYEPPLPLDHTLIGPAYEQMRAAVERGALEEALETGLKGLVRMSDDELAGLRGCSHWAGMAALTPTWARECAALGRLEPGAARYAGITAPTLLLCGSATAPHHAAAIRALEAALPDARTVVFEGQGHAAHLLATEAFAEAVARFLGA